MAFHFSRRKLAPTESADANELNVVPYLDILMNLIIFMLLSMAGLATWGMVKVDLPRTSDQAAPSAPLVLTVAIAHGGFVLTSSLDAEQAEIPRPLGGDYDFETLGVKLRELKARFPSERGITISADADVDYDALISTMDAARETPEGTQLFPEVTLAHF